MGPDTKHVVFFLEDNFHEWNTWFVDSTTRSEHVMWTLFFWISIPIMRIMELDKVKIGKFVDTKNWLQWKFLVQTVLDTRDALEVERIYVDQVKRRSRSRIQLTKEILVTTLDKKPLSFIMGCEKSWWNYWTYMSKGQQMQSWLSWCQIQCSLPQMSTHYQNSSSICIVHGIQLLQAKYKCGISTGDKMADEER